MVSFKLVATGVLATLPSLCQAHPSHISCTPEEWKVGDPINGMGVDVVTAATGSDCLITVPQSVDPCSTFSAKIETDVSGRKGIVSGLTGGGKFGGKDCVDYMGDESGFFEVTAPASGTVKVYAMCGSSGQYVRLATGKEVVVNGNSTVCSEASRVTTTVATFLFAVVLMTMN